MEVTSLIAEAGTATIGGIAKEAHAQLVHNRSGSGGLATAAKGRTAAAELWIARAPITIKLRLFCLPYAGGVSENVFGRYRSDSQLPYCRDDFCQVSIDESNI